MKQESYRLINDQVRRNAIMRINSIECDGKLKIVICDAGSKSDLQRGLQWRWYHDVANAGIGGKHESTKNGVHLISKYRFARPILIRDNSFFADLWNTWFTLHGDNEERMEWFVDTQVHTEKFNTSQMAEYLTDFQRYYTSKGVTLTDHDDRKLLEYEARR